MMQQFLVGLGAVDKEITFTIALKGSGGDASYRSAGQGGLTNATITVPESHIFKLYVATNSNPSPSNYYQGHDPSTQIIPGGAAGGGQGGGASALVLTTSPKYSGSDFFIMGVGGGGGGSAVDPEGLGGPTMKTGAGGDGGGGNNPGGTGNWFPGNPDHGGPMNGTGGTGGQFPGSNGGQCGGPNADYLARGGGGGGGFTKGNGGSTSFNENQDDPSFSNQGGGGGGGGRINTGSIGGPIGVELTVTLNSAGTGSNANSPGSAVFTHPTKTTTYSTPGLYSVPVKSLVA